MSQETRDISLDGEVEDSEDPEIMDLMGTEAGREQRDNLIRIIRRQNDVIEAEAATEEVAESADDAAADASATAD
jgi:hypothetical protein